MIISLTAVLFLSCGIPNFFYLSDSGYSFTKKTAYDGFEFKITSTAGSDGDLNKLTQGPGLLLMYYVDNSSATVSGEVYSNFNTKFNSTFRGSDGLGVSIGNIRNGESVISYVSGDNTYNLCAFGLENDIQRTPDFACDMDLRVNDNLDYFFKIELADSGTTNQQFLKLISSQDETFNEEDETIILKRFNISNFNTDRDSVNSDINTSADFSAVSPTDARYYIHVFAAASCQIGNFSNSYWTRMREVACIEVPVV